MDLQHGAWFRKELLKELTIVLLVAIRYTQLLLVTNSYYKLLLVTISYVKSSYVHFFTTASCILGRS